MGENYIGEHPLKQARKFVVTCNILKESDQKVLTTGANAPNERKEIAIPEGWYYWSHTGNGGKEEIVRDTQGRVLGVAINGPERGFANLQVTVRRKQDS